jgi:hypothetical protein
MLVPGRASRVILGAGLRHQDGKEEQPADRNGGEIEEADWIAEPLDDKACRQIAQTGTDADRQRDEPLRQIEPSGAAHEISRDDDRMTLKSPAATPSSSWIATTAKGLVLKRANSTPRNGNTPSMTRKMVLRPYPASSAALSRSVSTA